MKKSAELHVALGTPHDFIEINKVKLYKGAWIDLKICQECLYTEYRWLATSRWEEFNFHKDSVRKVYSPRFILSRYKSYEKFLDSHGDEFI